MILVYGLLNLYLPLNPAQAGFYVDGLLEVDGPSSVGSDSIIVGTLAVGKGSSPTGKFEVDNLVKFDDTNTSISLGTDALSNDIGINNLAIGLRAGINNDSSGAAGEGDANIFIGYEAGVANTTGKNNIFLGSIAGQSNTVGAFNFALGESSLRDNISGNSNIAIGRSAGLNTTGSNNVYVGANSGEGKTNESENTVVGANALKIGTAGRRNTVIGSAAAVSTTGDINVMIGYKAGFNHTTNDNTLIIDNQDRGSAAAEVTDSLIYGIFDASPVNQSVSINGAVVPLKVVADPCGTFPEGSIFYNNTSNYMCYCDGTNDVKMHDPTAACF